MIGRQPGSTQKLAKPSCTQVQTHSTSPKWDLQMARLPDDDEEVVGAAAQQAHVDAEKGKSTMPADDYEGEPESSGAGSSGEGPENEVDEKEEVAEQTPDDTQAAGYGGGTADNVVSSAGGGGGGDHTSTYA